MREIGLFDLFRVETRQQEQVVDEANLDTALRTAMGSRAITVSSALNIPAVSSSVSFIALSQSGSTGRRTDGRKKS